MPSYFSGGNRYLIATIVLCLFIIAGIFFKLLSPDWYTMEVSNSGRGGLIGNVTSSTSSSSLSAETIEMTMGPWRMCVDGSCSGVVFHSMTKCDMKPPQLEGRLWASRAFYLLSLVTNFVFVALGVFSIKNYAFIPPKRVVVLVALVLGAAAAQGIADAVFVWQFNSMFCGGDICSVLGKGEVMQLGPSSKLVSGTCTTKESSAVFLSLVVTILSFVAVFVAFLFNTTQRRVAASQLQQQHHHHHQQRRPPLQFDNSDVIDIVDSGSEIELDDMSDDDLNDAQQLPVKYDSRKSQQSLANPYNREQDTLPARRRRNPHATAAATKTSKEQPRTVRSRGSLSKANSLELVDSELDDEVSTACTREEEYLSEVDTLDGTEEERRSNRSRALSEVATETDTEDDDVFFPEGDDWELDRKNNMYWSPTAGMFWDTRCKRFFDPKINKWFDPQANKWSSS